MRGVLEPQAAQRGTPAAVAPTLSARLEAVAECVLRAGGAADIGTDHAALARALVERGIVEFVIATDIHERPWRAAHANAQHVAGRVELRLGDGLSVLRPGEAKTLVIAGMGGGRICSILERDDAVVAASSRVVIQPQTQWAEVRRFIAARGWPVVIERLVEDREHDYLVLAITPRRGSPHAWNERDFELGPMLRRHPTEAFERWLRREFRRCKHALERAKTSKRVEDPRVLDLVQRVALLGEALAAVR